MIIIRPKLLALTLCLGSISFACQKETFRGQQEPAKVVTKLVQGGCDPMKQATVQTTNLTGLKGSKVQVKGEFCAIQIKQVQIKPISIVFVIDESGSNEFTDKPNGMSCRRLEFIRAAVMRMKEYVATLPGANVSMIKASLITFHNNAYKPIPLTDVTSFESQVNVSNACGLREYTNYEDAFDMAQQTLVAAPAGLKVMYFLSDGQPTAMGITNKSQLVHIQSDQEDITRYVNAGEMAADRLRQALPFDFAFFGLYYKNPDYPMQAFNGEPDAKQYFDQLTGNPERAKIIEDARSLPNVIQTLPPPKPSAVDSDSVKAYLTAQGSNSRRTVSMDDFEPVAGQTGRYTFLTKPVELFGDYGRPVVNVVTVEAMGSDGKTRTAVVTINYQQRQPQ